MGASRLHIRIIWQIAGHPPQPPMEKRLAWAAFHGARKIATTVDG
jgi:hypothetical protein